MAFCTVLVVFAALTAATAVNAAALVSHDVKQASSENHAAVRIAKKFTANLDIGDDDNLRREISSVNYITEDALYFKREYFAMG